MSQKIVSTLLGVLLLLTQSGLCAMDGKKSDVPVVTNESVKPAVVSAAGVDEKKSDVPSTTKDKTEISAIVQKTLGAAVVFAKKLQQDLMQGRLTEEQALAAIHGWCKDLQNSEAGKAENLFNAQEVRNLLNMFIDELDLRELYQKKEMEKDLFELKAMADQKKVAWDWFKRHAERSLRQAYQRGLITGSEMGQLENKLGLVPLASRLKSIGLNSLLWAVRPRNLKFAIKNAIKNGIVIGALLCKVALTTYCVLKSKGKGYVVGGQRNADGSIKELRLPKQTVLMQVGVSFLDEIIDAVGLCAQSIMNLLGR